MARMKSPHRLLAQGSLLGLLMPLLAACGGDTPTQTPVAAAPTATTAAAAGGSNATVATPVPTPTVGEVTLGNGATRIEWWHISTAPDQRANWQTLAEQFVK